MLTLLGRGRFQLIGGRRTSRGGTAATRVVVVLAAALGVTALAPGTSQAAFYRLKDGKLISYQQLTRGGGPSSLLAPAPTGRHGAKASSGAARGGTPTQAPAPTKLEPVFNDLDYNGGPVMPSNTNYVIAWEPAGYKGTPFQAGYVNGVKTFFEDMAADSGKKTNSDSVAEQYNDVEGHLASYNSHFGGVVSDTDPLPANGCSNGSEGICLTDAQLQAEIDHAVAVAKTPADLTHEYFLLTPPSVSSCLEANACSANSTAPVFCAYHSYSAGHALYSNIPDLAEVFGCDPFEFCPERLGVFCLYPNSPADGVLSAVSHEHNETVTDPVSASGWQDFQPCHEGSGPQCGGENGDKCNNDGLEDEPVFEEVEPFEDVAWNESIHGHHYLIQRQWSNQGHQCIDNWSSNGHTAAASFTAAQGSGLTVNFNAGASTATGGVGHYVWQFVGGAPPQLNTFETASPTTSFTYEAPGTYTVALTVLSADGTSNGTARAVVVVNPPPSGEPASGPPPTPTPGSTGTGNGAGTGTATGTTATTGSSALCVVPKLKGKTLGAARKALGSAHCGVGHLKQPKHKPHGSPPAHKKWALVVTAQSIGAQTTKPAGTKVGLTLVYKLVHG